MTNQPANAGPKRGQAPLANTVPPNTVPPFPAAPPALHHQDAPRATSPRATAPRAAAAPRTATAPRAAAAPRTATAPRAATVGHRAARPGDAGPGLLAWVPYLLALAGVAVGVLLAFRGSTGPGTGLVGCSLLAAGLARLVLPPRLAGPLASRGKASDVLAFTAFGAGVLAVALMLP
jgi:DUF3017 family protein